MDAPIMRAQIASRRIFTTVSQAVSAVDIATKTAKDTLR